MPTKKFEDRPEFLELTKLVRRTWSIRTADAFLAFFANWEDLLGAAEEEGGVDLKVHRPDLKLLSAVKAGGIIQQLDDLQEEQGKNFNHSRGISMAMSGDMVLVLGDAAAEDITAAELNAGAAGTIKRSFTVRLHDSKSQLHLWYHGTPLVTPAESVADTDVGVPTVEGTPEFKNGAVLVTIIFDTDAGATKTYAAADSVTAQVQINATDSLLGYTLAAGGVTKIFNVV